MKRQMLVSLQTRYSDVECNKFFALATMLDPSFKQRVFSSAASAAMAKNILISEYESITSEQDLDPPTSKCQRVPAEWEFQVTSVAVLRWNYGREIWFWSFTRVTGISGGHLAEGAKPASKVQPPPVSERAPTVANIHEASLASKYLSAPPLVWLQKGSLVQLGIFLQKH